MDYIMMTSELLTKENERLKTLIEKRAMEIGFSDKIIFDGVAFPEKYLEKSPRILWILKESYETNNCYGWHVSKIDKPHPKMRSRGTLRQVCRISYAILQNCTYKASCKASDVDLLDAFQRIGWINLNKIAAGKTSPSDLTPQYNTWKDILKEQIDAYKPDIIICGNTLQYLSNDNYFDKSNSTRQSFKEGKQFCYYLFKDRLYINIHHPSFFNIDWHGCVDEIVKAVTDWKKL